MAVLAAFLLLGGCQMVLLSPSGDVALQQRNILLVTTALMLLVIVPVIGLTIYFAWRYRASAEATYKPDWNHSLPLEVVIWAVPLLIIIVIGAITWMGTHLLDPYRPLDRISASKPLTALDSLDTAQTPKPLKIQAIALDWKWLFLYPEQGVASLNELVAPIDRQIEFNLTSASVMNSFFVPALAGQIYAMPGMQTKLHAVINKQGDYEGFSANFSGPGFSDMRFRFRGVEEQTFNDWVKNAASSGAALGREEYLQIEKPSERESPRQFSAVDPELYAAILGRCVDRSRMCSHDMMAIDDSGGGGMAGINIVMRPQVADAGLPGSQSRPQRPYILAATCTASDIYGMALASLDN